MHLLEVLFTWFLSSTVRGSFMALFVLGLQMVLSRWIPARWRYVLWLPVILALILPSLITSPWSFHHSLLNNHLIQVQAPPAVDQIEPIQVVSGTQKTIPAVESPRVRVIPWEQIAIVVWLTGVMAFLLTSFIAYAANMTKIFRTQVQADPWFQELISWGTEQCGLSSNPRVVLSAEVGSPAITGLLKPTLLLPASFPGELSSQEAGMVLLHEMTHLKRGDLLTNWILFLIQALHWCNPIVWLAFSRLRHDREAACDEQVLATSTTDWHSEYGHALLKLSSQPSPIGWSLGFVGILENSSKVRDRIHRIVSYRPSHPVWGIVSLFLILLLSLVGVLRAQETKVSPKDLAKKLIIPSLHFDRVSLADVITEIQKQSVDLDPNKIGIKIVSKAATDPTTENPPRFMRLNLTNLSVFGCLQFIASLSYNTVTWDNEAFYLSPQGSVPRLTQAERKQWEEASQTVLAADPILKVQYDDNYAQTIANLTQLSAAPDDQKLLAVNKALVEQGKALKKAMEEAEVKQDPTIQPILDKLAEIQASAGTVNKMVDLGSPGASARGSLQIAPHP